MIILTMWEQCISKYTVFLCKEVSIFHGQGCKISCDINKKEFIEIVDKLKAVVNNKEGSKNYMDYFTIQPKSNLDYEKHKKLCNDINFSYIAKRKINITYRSLTSGYSNRNVHPYGLFNYKGDVYMVAYCENKEQFLDFKICRIIKI